MLYRTIQKELPKHRQTGQFAQKVHVPKVVTISLLNPPWSYRLIRKKGMAKVVKLFI
jgi:hypothetical protein